MPEITTTASKWLRLCVHYGFFGFLPVVISDKVASCSIKMSEGFYSQYATPIIDWLHRARQRKIIEDDLHLLRRLVLIPAAFLARSLVLDEAFFESTVGLNPLPTSGYDATQVDSALGASRATESITGWDLPLAAKGGTLRRQIESLLPEYLPNRQSIIYALCRIVIDDVPSKRGWDLFSPGLDPLASAILAIHELAKTAGKRPAWLEVLWRVGMQWLKVGILKELLSSLDTSPTAESMKTRLQEARDRLRAVIPQDPLGSTAIDYWLAVIPDDIVGRLPDDMIDKLRQGEAEGKKKRNGILEELELIESSSVVWPVMTLRSDGPLAADSEPILNELRQEVNALDYRPVRDICAYLADRPMPGSPTGADVANATGFTEDASYHALTSLQMLITESYIPFIGSMGLRYRYLIMPHQRRVGQSFAVAEKYFLRNEQEGKSANAEAGRSGFSLAVGHIEPADTYGPNERELPGNTFSITVGSELVSVRLDLYDVGKSMWREPWNERRPAPRSSILHLVRAEPPPPEHYTIPVRREIDALSILWSFRGTRRARRWLFDKMGFPAGTAEHIVPNLFRKRLLGLMYHPALEFCGLPEGIFICSKGMSARELLSFSRWVTGVFPYCRIQTDRSVGDVVAVVRVPRLRSALASEVFRERLKGIGCEFMVAPIQSYRSYFMTVLNRLYNPSSGNWSDPWS